MKSSTDIVGGDQSIAVRTEGRGAHTGLTGLDEQDNLARPLQLGDELLNRVGSDDLETSSLNNR